MTTTPVVTYADLMALHDLRATYNPTPGDAIDKLLDRLIAAAEADRPPLPEGWVLHTTPAGSRAVFWHRDGYLQQWDDDDRPSRRVQQFPGSTTTPLRPTVTEADVEKAVDVYMEARGLSSWQTQEEIPPALRAAFEAAGIEVTP